MEPEPARHCLIDPFALTALCDDGASQRSQFCETDLVSCPHAVLVGGLAEGRLCHRIEMLGPIERTDWAAAGFDDTDLSFLSFLELYGTEIAERRMPARRVVEALDVVEEGGAQLDA